MNNRHMSTSEWDQLTNISLSICSAGYKGLNKYTNTRLAQSVCKGMLTIGPPSHCNCPLKEPVWGFASYSLKEICLLMTVVSRRSEAAARTSGNVRSPSVNCGTVLNSKTGLPCEHRARWPQSQRRKHSQIWKRRHNAPLSSLNNEHVTANTSSMSKARRNRCQIRTIVGCIPPDFTYRTGNTSLHSNLSFKS